MYETLQLLNTLTVCGKQVKIILVKRYYTCHFTNVVNLLAEDAV